MCRSISVSTWNFSFDSRPATPCIYCALPGIDVAVAAYAYQEDGSFVLAEGPGRLTGARMLGCLNTRGRWRRRNRNNLARRQILRSLEALKRLGGGNVEGDRAPRADL
jgi:hypothetical protein